MTDPIKPDGDAMDPAIARVLLFYREAVAEATAKAFLDLRQLGLDQQEVEDVLRAPVEWTRRRYPSISPA